LTKIQNHTAVERTVTNHTAIERTVVT